MYFLPTFNFLRTFFLILKIATPFLLVFALYFFPLNFNVILPFKYLPLTFFKETLILSFLADFLTFKFLAETILFIVMFLFNLTLSYVAVIVYLPGFASSFKIAYPFLSVMTR